MILVAWALARAGSTQTVARQPQLSSEGLTGYIGMDVPANSEEFGYGVSLYAAAWPLLKRPLRDFQIGLASIWIVPRTGRLNIPYCRRGRWHVITGQSAAPVTGMCFKRLKADWFLGEYALLDIHRKVPDERNSRWLQP